MGQLQAKLGQPAKAQIQQEPQEQMKVAPRDIEQIFRQQILENIVSQEAHSMRLEEIQALKKRQALEEAYPFSKNKPIYTKSQKPIRPRPRNKQKPEEEKSSQDGRKKIEITDQWPYSAHGVVAVKFNEEGHWGTGTGTLIGPNIVLTAAHNLYNHQQKSYAKLESMEFIPGMNGDMLPFGSCKVKRYFLLPIYVEQKKEDFGLLILEENIGEKTGYFGIAVVDQQDVQSRRINITEYLAHEGEGKGNTYEMWSFEDRVACIDGDNLSYPIDIYEGQSGGGVWYEEEDKRFIVGIHGLENNDGNKGTIITKERYQQIREWIAEASGTRLDNSLFERGCRELEVRKERFSADELSILLEYNLNDLEILRLRGYSKGDRAIKTLSGNTTWMNLSELDLQGNEMDVEDIRALSQNIIWTNLTIKFIRK